MKLACKLITKYRFRGGTQTDEPRVLAKEVHEPLNLTNSQRALWQPCTQNSYGSYQWGPLSSGKKSSGSFSCFYQEFGRYQTKPALPPLEALGKEKKRRQIELCCYFNLWPCVWTGLGRQHTGADLRSDCRVCVCVFETFTWAVGGVLLFSFVGLQSLRVHSCRVLGDAHGRHLLSYRTGGTGTGTQAEKLVRVLTKSIWRNTFSHILFISKLKLSFYKEQALAEQKSLNSMFSLFRWSKSDNCMNIGKTLLPTICVSNRFNLTRTCYNKLCWSWFNHLASKTKIQI